MVLFSERETGEEKKGGGGGREIDKYSVVWW